MEISNLQNMWTELEQSAEQKQVTIAADDIEQGIKSQSTIIYAHVGRGLKRKALISGIFSVTPGIAATQLFVTGINDSFLSDLLSASTLGILLSAITIIMLIVAIFNWQGHLLIDKFQASSASLRISNQKSISVLERIQSIEVWSDTIGVPVIGFIVISGWLYSSAAWQLDYRLLALVGLTSAISLWGYFAARKVNQRFQPYINELEKQALDLKDKA
jgi:hypothetical protein